jgi:transcriptional regulator with XRE-family HTH domain
MRGPHFVIGGPTAHKVVAERLDLAMKEAGLNQSELARRVGSTPAAINQILKHKTNVSRFAPDIARELGVALDWLNGQIADPRVDRSINALTSDEQRLLAIYRLLPKKDRSALKVLIERMARDE